LNISNDEFKLFKVNLKVFREFLVLIRSILGGYFRNFWLIIVDLGLNNGSFKFLGAVSLSKFFCTIACFFFLFKFENFSFCFLQFIGLLDLRLKNIFQSRAFLNWVLRNSS